MKITGIQARINPNGRIVIPAMIRKGMGLKLGDPVVMSLDDGVLRIEARRPRTRATQDALRDSEPEMPASDKALSRQPDDSPSQTEEWLG